MEPIFNADLESIEKPNKNQGFARHTLTNQSLTSYMERGDSRVNSARRQTPLDLRIQITGTVMGLESAGDEVRYLPVTGAWYLPTGRGYIDQTGHNVFEVREVRNPWLFVLIYSSKATCLLVCCASHTYVHSPMFQKKSSLGCSA